MTSSQSPRVLTTLAQSALTGTAETAGLHQALAQAFDATPVPSTEVELAQQALALLEGDPAWAGPIQALTSQPETRSSFTLDPAALSVTAAALLALQTRVKFKRDTKGAWTFEIEKKAATGATLKPLIERLLYFLPK